MLADVFQNSAIYPVLGSQDFWPTNFFPFQNRTDEETNYWKRNKSKKELYKTESLKLIDELQGSEGISKNTVLENGNLQDFGYYKLKDVKYIKTPSYNTDAQGNVISTTYSYSNLDDTHFIGLNT